MRRWLLVLAVIFLLQGRAVGADLPRELLRAAPEAAEVFDGTGAQLISSVQTLFGQAVEEGWQALTGGIKTAILTAAGVLALGLVEAAVPDKKNKVSRGIVLAGTLWITAVTAGDLSAHIGMGRKTIGRLAAFSKLLIPSLAAATAATGAVTSAGTGQVAAVFFSDIMMTVIEHLLLPGAYLYIGLVAASTVLEGDMLGTIAAFIQKAITWGLKLLLGMYTAFLAVSGAVTGAADQRAVQAAKTAVSVTVPVVGGILSQAAETVLAGAGLLRSTLGAFGAVAVLGICLTPAVHLGGQYFLYQSAALVGGCGGPKELKNLISMLSQAFALVLAMTASCAVMLLISIVSALRVVVG